MLSPKGFLLAVGGSSCAQFWDRLGKERRAGCSTSQCAGGHGKQGFPIQPPWSEVPAPCIFQEPAWVSWDGALVQAEEAPGKQQRRNEEDAMKTKQKAAKATKLGMKY